MGLQIQLTQALKIAKEIGYPVLVRPSYVLRWKSNANCI